MKIYNEQRIGETHMSNEGYETVVVKGSKKKGRVVVKIDGKYEKTVKYSKLVNGNIKNPYHRSAYGKGCIGIGKHKVSIKGVLTKKYEIWSGMLQRCYDSEYHQEYPAYKDVTVCDEWHNYQNFGDWYDERYKEEWWQLNNDLLSGGKKLYSPETCVFIPIELEYFLIRREMKRRLYLGIFDTVEEAGLAYINNQLLNMTVWLRYLDNHPRIERRVYKGMKVIYEEYKKEQDDLRRIASESSANN